MSTNIGPAYALKSRDFREIDQKVNELRRELAVKARELMLRDIARRALTSTDCFMAKSGNPTQPVQPVSTAIREFFKEVDETVYKRERNPSSDMQFTFSLHYYRGRFYTILFTEQKEFVKAFEAKFEGEDFSYYNGSDSQLNEMTVRQWHRRRDVWNKILSNSSVPAMNGSGYTVVEPVRWMNDDEREKIADYLDLSPENFEKRVREQAISHAMKVVLEEMKQSDPEASATLADESDDNKTSLAKFDVYMKAYWKVQDGARGDDERVAAIFAEKCDQVRPLLNYDAAAMINHTFEPERAEESAAGAEATTSIEEAGK